MFTPSPGTAGALQTLDAIMAARAEGVPWLGLGLADAGPADPLQLEQARAYIQFRSGLDDTEDPDTVERGARVLRAREDAMLREKVWGLTDDPTDPSAADFSDVARSLDQRAAQIHTPARYTGRGRHVAP